MCLLLNRSRGVVTVRLEIGPEHVSRLFQNLTEKQRRNTLLEFLHFSEKTSELILWGLFRKDERQPFLALSSSTVCEIHEFPIDDKDRLTPPRRDDVLLNPVMTLPQNDLDFGCVFWIGNLRLNEFHATKIDPVDLDNGPCDLSLLEAEEIFLILQVLDLLDRRYLLVRS